MVTESSCFVAEHGGGLGVMSLCFFTQLTSFIEVPVQLQILSLCVVDLSTSALTTLVLPDVAKAGVLDLAYSSILSHLQILSLDGVMVTRFCTALSVELVFGAHGLFFFVGTRIFLDCRKVTNPLGTICQVSKPLGLGFKQLRVRASVSFSVVCKLTSGLGLSFRSV